MKEFIKSMLFCFNLSNNIAARTKSQNLQVQIICFIQIMFVEGDNNTYQSWVMFFLDPNDF
jgi:hypothetical protein